MLNCAMFSVITLVNLNVSSLHPTRKGLLKLIVVRISFPERSPDVPLLFVTMSICVSSQLLTPVSHMNNNFALRCVMLNIINNLFI